MNSFHYPQPQMATSETPLTDFRATQFNPWAKLHSGVESLDAAIQPIYQPGNSLIIGIPSAGGKTILTGQIAGNRIWQGFTTLVVSTEETRTGYYRRIISAIAGIPFGQIVDGISHDAFGIPSEQKYGKDAALRSYALKQRGCFAEFPQRLSWLMSEAFFPTFWRTMPMKDFIRRL